MYKKSHLLIGVSILILIAAVSVVLVIIPQTSPAVTITYIGSDVGPSIFKQDVQQGYMNNSGMFNFTIPYNETSIYLAYSGYCGDNGFPATSYEFKISVAQFDSDTNGLSWLGNGVGRTLTQGNGAPDSFCKAMQPLLLKYNLLPVVENYAISSGEHGLSTLVTNGTATNWVFWTSTYDGGGVATLMLYGNGNKNPLNGQQITSLTQDLQGIMATAEKTE